MEKITAKIENPLSEFIRDDIYELLSSHGFIDEKSVGDFLIRKKFKQLRDAKIFPADAIDKIREDYHHLRFDTIRKIVYQENSLTAKKIWVL